MNIDEFLDTANVADGDCIGCGYCCIKTKCEAGHRLYAETTPCPALIWNGERHVCDLMNLPGTLGDKFKKELHAGAGCCSNLNSWRREPLINRIPPKTKVPDNPIPPIMQKFIRALASEMISSDKIALVLGTFARMLKKDGMPTEQIKVVLQNCVRYFNENRSKFMTDFMG